MSITYNRELLWIFWCTLLATIGYGVSFPFLAIGLERLGASPMLIGLNAAMPPLAWLLLTPFLPRITASVPSTKIVGALIALIGASLFLMALIQVSYVWTLLRFVFGGAIGLLFRYFEYRLTLICSPDKRGRLIGTYSALFVCGIAIGSVIQPLLGQDLMIAPIVIFTGFLLGAAPLLLSNVERIASKKIETLSYRSLLLRLPLAVFIGIFVYGLVEDLMAYLMSIVALHVGHDETVAAYTLSTFALGALIGGIPVGYLGDRFGRPAMLRVLTVLATITACTLTLWISDTVILFICLFSMGLFIPGIYNTCLAMLADQWSAAELAAANAKFGTLYAGASIIGPLLFGGAMSLSDPMGAPILLSLILFAAAAVMVFRGQK